MRCKKDPLAIFYLSPSIWAPQAHENDLNLCPSFAPTRAEDATQ